MEKIIRLGGQLKKLGINHGLYSAIATTLLLSSAAWILGDLIWRTVEPDSAVVSTQKITASGRNSSALQDESYNLSELEKLSLFGEVNKAVKAPPKTQAVIQAPKTKLNVSLVGIVASNNPKFSLAVIAHKGKQETYGIEDTIKGTRASLVAIYANKVIIKNNGRDETLMMAGVKEEESTSKRPSRSPNTRSGDKNSQELAKIKQEIVKNPGSLMNYIRLSQVKKNNKIQGFRVNPGRDRRLFDDVGLKANDLAVSLNGFDLTNNQEISQIWQQLSTMSEFNLTVERDGQRYDIYVGL
ncbi:type II secretion system protein GspC [Vibrio sp. SS-MA-C1-2]|uniref:type II secretion system protein GspC n=1 Tax=Vibrio sp. SS-MA-C1-2 TaxID=2908646 RepID=UPI001F2DB89C|nr:type II secretion system protein GspC [Vibrio sp. SS-MA-C1-2]UJF19442.1 type II secretion system protein GspC [Vibrio sp. SS-MA-C1-2]